MFKAKSLYALIAVAVTALVLSLFGVTLATPARAAELEKVTTGFEYEDAAKTTISGFTLPENVKGDYEVVIPAGVTAIGKDAFKGSALKGVTLNEGLVSIDDYAFTQSAITSIAIPGSVTGIGEHAFHGCTSLSSVTFAGRTENLAISSYAFAGCRLLRTLSLPDSATVSQFAFEDCSSLSWVYVGNNCKFINSAGSEFPDAVFFPVNTALTIVFPSKTAYDAMADETFVKNNGQSATYIVTVNCYVGSNQTPVVYERLHGEQFNYVRNKSNGTWNTDTAYSDLPAQDPTYSKTTWYSEKTLENTVSYDDVNALLEKEGVGAISLFCHETIAMPKLPAEPVSWVYKSNVAYEISDLSQVLKAVGCGQEFTEAQLAVLNDALEVNVVFADEKGNVADTPAAINGNGVYSVTLSLKDGFGEWSQPFNSTVTVNVDTTGFNVVLIVFLVLGVLAVAVTVSTAVIRKKVQARNKKKQLTQKEILEKFKATGEQTTLA